MENFKKKKYIQGPHPLVYNKLQYFIYMQPFFPLLTVNCKDRIREFNL